MTDQTKACRINHEQYDFLNTERGPLNTFAATGMLSNLPPAYLLGAANIYASIFGQQRPNINCKHCIMAFLRPLLNQLQKFEQNV
jgi:hypothetical protein